jgi:hypothetical protein
MRSIWPLGFALICLCGCSSGGSDVTPAENPSPAPEHQVIELLFFEGCPNAVKLRDRLRQALTGDPTGWEVREVNLSELSPADDRLRYGSPTLIVRGRDLFGAAPASGRSLSCRVYRDAADGVPAPDEIASRLKER